MLMAVESHNFFLQLKIFFSHIIFPDITFTNGKDKERRIVLGVWGLTKVMLFALILRGVLFQTACNDLSGHYNVAI